MKDVNGEYINGYIERTREGRYEGEIVIEGVSLSPIVGVMFKQDDKNYLWVRRKEMLVYNSERQCYISQKREPRWEAYLEKQTKNNLVTYKGEFAFLRFRFSIIGMWDSIIGRDKSRINFYVERLPMAKQDIIQGLINKDTP